MRRQRLIPPVQDAVGQAPQRTIGLILILTGCRLLSRVAEQASQLLRRTVKRHDALLIPCKRGMLCGADLRKTMYEPAQLFS